MAAPATSKKDEWEDLAKVYRSVTENPTTRPSTDLVEKANARWPFSSATSILDNGCGPGIVTSTLIKNFGHDISTDTKIVAGDFSPAMLQQVKNLQDKEKAALAEDDHDFKLWAALEPKVLDAHVLDGVEDASLSHVLGGFVYMLLPDPTKALRATHRVLKPDGVVALSSWEPTEWQQVMEIASTARLPDEWVTCEGVKGELEKAGFRNIEATQVETFLGVENYDDQVDFFMTKVPPVVASLKEKSPEQVDAARQAMLVRLKQLCPTVPGRMRGTAIVAVAQK